VSYIPLSLNLTNKKILIVGGGEIALRKLLNLLEFSDNITLISKVVLKELNDLKLSYNLILKDFAYTDMIGFDIVVVCVDDIKLQKSIYFEAKKNHILCNCVDLLECCDFIFPASIKKGDLTISISTNGSSPAFAKQLKYYLLELIPDDVGEFLGELKSMRKTLPKGKERMKIFDKKVKDFLKKW